MKNRKRVMVAVPVIAGSIALFALLLPSEYKVEKSVLIEASPETVFSNINNLSRWQAWSMWSTEYDPAISNIYAGPEKGVGATYRWLGDATGKGTLTITESIDGKQISYEMHREGQPGKTQGKLLIEPVNQGTMVTWIDEGTLGHNPLKKVCGPLQERKMARFFETGLAGLKKISENKPELTLNRK